MSPGQQRAAVDYLAEEYSLSQRRACRLMDRPRSTIRYRPKPAADQYRSGTASLDDALIERRQVWFAGAPAESPVWERERLPAGAHLRGPGIIEEFGATTVLPPDWAAQLDAHGNLLLEREAAA